MTVAELSKVLLKVPAFARLENQQIEISWHIRKTDPVPKGAFIRDRSGQLEAVMRIYFDDKVQP